MRIALKCDGDYVVPRNPPGSSRYPRIVGPNQACTLYGATPGLDTVDGAAYISAGFSLNVHDLWRHNFVGLVGWFLFYQVVQVILIEYLNASHFYPSSDFHTKLISVFRDHADKRMSRSSERRIAKPRL